MPAECSGKMTLMVHWQSYFRLLNKLKPYWKLLSLAAVALLLNAAATAALPFLAQHALDAAFIAQDLALIQTIALTLIALVISRSAASCITHYMANKSSGYLAIDLQKDFFDKLLSLPVSRYSQWHNDDRATVFINDINQVSQIFAHQLTQLAQDCLIVTGLFLSLLNLNQEFAVLLLLVTAVIALIQRMADHHFSNPGSKSSQANEKLLRHLAESIKHYRKIRLDGGQAYESHRLNKMSGKADLARIQQTAAKAMVILVIQVIAALILIAIGYSLAFQAINGTLSLPATGALLTAALLLLAPARRILDMPKQIESVPGKLESIFAFLDQPSECAAGNFNIPKIHGELVFDQVHYACEGQSGRLLDSINFTIKPEEVVVFTGYTDPEKNALIDLITGLQSPAGGYIRLDGQPLEKIKREQLHAGIALVANDTFLLDENIAGNIAYGAKHCTDEAAITAAAYVSHAATFIRRMPGGLQTQIGQKEAGLNQKQFVQLAIARAFVKNAPILILDEIFTWPDSEHGHTDLHAALDKLMINRTPLIFSQQIPSQLKKIDRVIVLRNGAITEILENYRP